jgi:hypothetical protein
MHSRSVYRVSPRRRWALIAVWLLLAMPLAFGGLLADPALLIAAAVVSVVFLPLIALTAWWYPRLVLTPAGVTLVHIGWSLEVPWERVASLRSNPGSEGLVLREPLDTPGAWRLFRASQVAPYYGPDQLALIAERRFVPIEPFAYWLRRGELARDLVRHAPWAMADTAKRAGSPKPP